MSYELEFEAEPFEAETSASPKSRCGCGSTELESEFGVGDIVGAAAKAATAIGRATAGLVAGGSRIIDLTAKADKSVRKGTRDPRTVTALVLHQMACCSSRKDPLNSYLKINSHYTILRDGRILQMHPISSLLWASNGFNQRSVAVEFAGIFAGLGAETTLIYRGPKILRGFDEDLRDGLTEELGRRLTVG